MKEVHMSAIVRIPAGCTFSKDNVACIDFGSYTFVIAETAIPFDFEGYSADIELDEKGMYIEMQTTYSGFFKNTDIDKEVFAKDYAEIGIDAESITAEFLASASEIESFYFNVVLKNGEEIGEDFILESVVFVDENGDEHEVNDALLGIPMSSY